MAPEPSSETANVQVAEPRRRADWEESRQRILDAATQLFSARGYRRTSTRELADAAGVAETTLFRHCPTKARLFEEAVIAPLRQSVADLTERRRAHPPDVRTEDASQTFYDEMLETLRADSRLLIGALAALTFEEETSEFSGLTGAFSELNEYMDEVLRIRSAERGFEVDPVLAGRIMLAMSLGLALCDRMLFDENDHPSHEKLVSELAKLTAYGLPGKPPG
jgi:AcrR family transcriptional regulator